jgi:hypothetical protein
MRRPRRDMVVVAAMALAVLTAGCASDSNEDASSAPQAAAGGKLDLAGVCPATVVVQTGWYPQVERGAVYSLVGRGYKIDANKKRVTGPLVAQGHDTGVDIEVRAGGPAIGYQMVTAQMYSDKSIMLGDVPTDESVQNSLKQPTLEVVAPLEIDPLGILWDPATYHQFNTVVDIGQTDTTVLEFADTTATEYLIGTGILRRDQVDASYDGSPSRFVASGGKVAVAAFATNEPYLFEHEVKAWGKPVAFGLLYDTGYPTYGLTTLAIRAGEKARLAPCLERLVPIIQRAQVSFMANPKPTTDLILKQVTEFGGGFIYSQGLADFAVKQMRNLNLVSNGPNKTLGDFDMQRVQRSIDVVRPVFQAQNKPVRNGLKPEDIATNEFIDLNIGLSTS